LVQDDRELQPRTPNRDRFETLPGRACADKIRNGGRSLWPIISYAMRRSSVFVGNELVPQQEASLFAADLSDHELAALHESVVEEMDHVLGILRLRKDQIEGEIIRRCHEAGAKSLPDKDFDITIEAEYAPYQYDLDALRKASKLLPPEEAKKVVKHLPSWTEVHPEKWEPGNPVSINALIRKYPETSDEVRALRRGMGRVFLRDKAKVKRRPS
jgi:hypothetical protein